MPPSPYNTHRGGWSTSICDLFANSRQRSNCCALACCGLLLSDRNAHLMLNEQRPSWWKRFCWNLGMPVGILLCLNVLETFLATEDNILKWEASIFWIMFIIIVFLLYRAKFERMQVRRAVMAKLYEMRIGGRADVITASLDSYQQLHIHDVRMAHATCSCFPKDVIYNTQHESDADADADGQHLVLQEAPPRDLCMCLWDTVKSIFCGTCCGCWIQLCGMCAIGQEDREIQQLLDKKQLQVDYITFQPYFEYYPEIMALRAAQDGSLIRHWRALSLLSYNLVKILGACLAILTAVALLELDPKFQIQNLFVVVATFGQAFLILYFCHWQWHRFDLSTDALVKYFSSGFILCTFLAIIYEMIVSSVFGFISYIIVVVGISQDVSQAASPAQIQQAGADFAKEHVGIFAIFVFLNAFVVAALVEEMCKYFGYWMVETPDTLDPDDLVMETADASQSVTATVTPSESEQEGQSGPELLSPKRSSVSHGAGITVAMIAVAAGFACSENLLYVFVYTPPGLSNEIATLVARSMFPIHPLCAAIQSIGVVRRDVEKNGNFQLGRIMFPAIILHGAFDFVLMFLALLESSRKTNAEDDQSNEKVDDATFEDFDQGDSLPMIISISMVIVGLFYYVCDSGRQRKRLQELDEGLQGCNEYVV